ncbi:hypothetical protein ABGB14_16390 [Nonomuraea sp. B10E15]|uniref:hypothetical protein n=1 Tax=Nonomuraea sp. B10E15 TaxID=3153560 RepID=UPI00325D3D80
MKLVPLWFAWHEQAVWLSTRATSPTGRNLRNGGRTRLAFADTQDVVLLDDECRTISPGSQARPARPARDRAAAGRSRTPAAPAASTPSAVDLRRTGRAARSAAAGTPS